MNGLSLIGIAVVSPTQISRQVKEGRTYLLRCRLLRYYSNSGYFTKPDVVWTSKDIELTFQLVCGC
jgi:hypothetical protein